MGAYYRDVVVVIELGTYIHGVLTFNGCLLSQFRGILGRRGGGKIPDCPPSNETYNVEWKGLGIRVLTGRLQF